MRFSSKSIADSGRHDDGLVEAAATWLVRMRSDLVGDADRRAFEAWLARDPSHGQAYAQAEALWGEVGEIPDPRMGSDVTDRSHGEATHRAPRTRPRRRRAMRWYGAAAASVVLAAAVGLWSAGGYDGLRADYVTAVGETRTVTLADGSTVQLNTDTAIAVDFSQTRRRIDLYRGEAFFTVTKDESRPFEVVAGNGTSRAVGTAFDVLDAERSVTVAVEEGAVRVSRLPRSEAGAENDAAGIILHAGESARYGRTGDIEVRRDDDTAATAWRQGRLVFANRPLRDVVAELDRYRSGAIVFLDSDVARARFTGVFNLRDTDRALAAIEGSLAVDVIRVTPWLTLLRARD
jgi:transmembrane sensor